MIQQDSNIELFSHPSIAPLLNQIQIVLSGENPSPSLTLETKSKRRGLPSLFNSLILSNISRPVQFSDTWGYIDLYLNGSYREQDLDHIRKQLSVQRLEVIAEHICTNRTIYRVRVWYI